MPDISMLRTPARPSPDALLSYWTSLRQGSSLPRRRDIDPRAIEGLLPYTFILERIAPGLARFRVAGAQVGAVMGLDLRGIPISCLMTTEARAPLAEGLEALFTRPGSLRADLTGPVGKAEMLVLPLCDDHGHVERAIGCLMVETPHSQPPRRFSLSQMQVTPVVERQALAPHPHLRLVVST